MAKLSYKQDETTYKIWDTIEKCYITRNTKTSEQSQWKSTTWVHKYLVDLCKKVRFHSFKKQRYLHEYEVHVMETKCVEVIPYKQVK